ncbi:MAG: hypothetical protein Q9167_001064 [Letrouitia subvulpina]
MSTSLRLRAPNYLAPRIFSSYSLRRRYATSGRTSDRVPTNDPEPPAPVQNVSDSNAVPIDPQGLQDAPLQEYPEDNEKLRQMQAPNRRAPWSRSQQPRERAMSGPRFEQTIMELQAHENNRKMLQSLPSTTYPLEPQGHSAEVPESQRVSDEPFGQR